MVDIRNTMKDIFIKSMEAISTTATNLANNTKTKVNEMNMVTRRQEILSSFGAKAYELWKDGAQFPEELQALLNELAGVDAQLEELRAARMASAQQAQAEEAPAEENVEEADAEETVEEAVEDIAEEAVEAVDEVVDAVAEVVEEAAETIDEAIEDEEKKDGAEANYTVGE